MQRLQSAGSSSELEVPTLHQLCCDVICTAGSINLDNALDALTFARTFGVIRLSESVERFCCNCWGAMLDRHDLNQLEEALGSELFHAISHEHRKLVEGVKWVHRTGEVVQPIRIVSNEWVYSPKSQRRTLPYELLRTGNAWPSEVDVAHRERFLSSSDFERLLGCTAEQFASLPSWKQASLKKRVDLF